MRLFHRLYEKRRFKIVFFIFFRWLYLMEQLLVQRYYGIVLMVPVLFFCNITFDLPLMVWVGLLFMAGVSGGLAVWLWSIAQKHVEPSILGSFGYLSATGATLFSAIFLKEKITFPFIFAFILVLGAMALILKNDRKKESCSQ